MAVVALALDGAARVPWAQDVTFSVAGTPVARLKVDLAGDRVNWAGCPATSPTYEGRECPVSPMRTIEQYVRGGGAVTVEAGTPLTVGCTAPSPPSSDSPRSVSIRPAVSDRDCFSDFAVTLFLDDSGDVLTVDLVLSGP